MQIHMVHMIVGLGEIGTALKNIISKRRITYTFDTNGQKEYGGQKVNFLHICFPFNDKFIESVLYYIKEYSPAYTIIHSTVPVGTTSLLSNINKEATFLHSPVRGRHPDLEDEIRYKYIKYISYDLKSVSEKEIDIIKDEFEDISFMVKIIEGTRKTELGKLLELARYGVSLAFAKEQESICKSYGMEYDDIVKEFVSTMNAGISEKLRYPELYPFDKYVGGHCVTENMQLLSRQTSIDGIKAPLLNSASVICSGTVIWNNCNIYPSARIGKGVSIGANCEIGNNVIIGNDSRIGAGSFIPEGVTIEENCFIAPNVSFSNDKKPPSKDKSKWGKILVKKNAVIGMGSIILPNVTIGENAVVGAGSCVTKDVPDNMVVYGNPAKEHGLRSEVYGKE